MNCFLLRFLVESLPFYLMDFFGILFLSFFQSILEPLKNLFNPFMIILLLTLYNLLKPIIFRCSDHHRCFTPPMSLFLWFEPLCLQSIFKSTPLLFMNLHLEHFFIKGFLQEVHLLKTPLL